MNCSKCNQEMEGIAFAQGKSEGEKFKTPAPVHYSCVNKECVEDKKTWGKG